MAVLIQKIGGLYFEANRWRQDWQAVDSVSGEVVNSNRACFGDPRKPDPKTPPDKATVDALLASILVWVVQEHVDAQAKAVYETQKTAYITAKGFADAEAFVKRCVETDAAVTPKEVR